LIGSSKIGTLDGNPASLSSTAKGVDVFEGDSTSNEAKSGR
jgi:hypothetical protein